MALLTKNTMLTISGVLLLIYVVMAVYIPIEWIRLFAGVIMTAFAAAAAILWLPDALRLIREGKIETSRVTLIAVALVTTGTAFIGAYSIIFNMMGRPAWLSDMPVYALGQLLLAFGNFLLTASPSEPTPTFRTINAWLIAGAVVIGVIVGFLLGLGVENTVW